MEEITTDTIEASPLADRHRDFESFYRQRWHEVYRPLALTLRDPDLAREAVDEAMIRAYRRWRSVRDYRNQAGWVYRVAFNWAMSQLRRRRREVFGRRPVDRTQPPEHPELDLYDAVSALAPRHRSVVVLRYLQDWSEAEVAEALGVPVGTVKSRLNRAIARLRKDLT